jgi:hypothetical protein
MAPRRGRLIRGRRGAGKPLRIGHRIFPQARYPHRTTHIGYLLARHNVPKICVLCDFPRRTWTTMALFKRGVDELYDKVSGPFAEQGILMEFIWVGLTFDKLIRDLKMEFGLPTTSSSRESKEWLKTFQFVTSLGQEILSFAFEKMTKNEDD